MSDKLYVVLSGDIENTCVHGVTTDIDVAIWSARKMAQEEHSRSARMGVKTPYIEKFNGETGQKYSDIDYPIVFSVYLDENCCGYLFYVK